MQARFIAAHVPKPYELHVVDDLTPLPGATPSERHACRLNELIWAVVARRSLRPTDRLLVLDSDAFPIRDLTPLYRQLHRAKLYAIQRVENGDEHTHPSFVLTTFAQWEQIFPGGNEPFFNLDACGGNADRRDTGGYLYQRLRQLDFRWTALRRSNAIDFAPVLFGIYGGAIYHHGCGSRSPKVAAHIVATNGSDFELRRLAVVYERMSARIFRLLSTDDMFYRIFEHTERSCNQQQYLHPAIRSCH